MHRFFADESGIVDGVAYLGEEDSRHALRVLRLEVGDEVELVADTVRYQAGIAAIEDGIVAVAIRGELRATEAKTQVTLYQGLPKADKMELIAQKATELGVYAIRPVAMERCVVKLEGKDAGKKIDRWQKIAREAVKQCARIDVPEIREPKKLSAMQADFAALDVLIVPWEDARDGSIRQCLAPYEGQEELSVGVLIGPEGGISEKEAKWLAQNAGAKLVTLGPRILRTETAAIAAVTMVMMLRGEME
jgi:16S rRNA (uracil1498-N3)-methyltransferase